MFDVDETIKFLLKGTVENYDVDAVKAKVEEVNKEGRFLNIKFGLDPSAPDIHLGHTVPLRKIRQMQNLGHKATIIIGDFTGMIGDPTGKSKTRKQLTREQVAINAQTYFEQIFNILDKDKTEILMNSKWYENMTLKEVIELCSKATVARILERDDFAKRYKNGEPISVHEFLYPLMQAYDSVVVKSDIELGGTDQMFNILMGRNMQKNYGVSQQVPIFVPILEGIDGVEKMSKSLGNYIGIKEDANSMFEKVMKIPDNLITKYYELTTDVHPDKVLEIKKQLLEGKVNPRDLKMDLAREITNQYHTKEETKMAEEHFVSIFQKKVAPSDITELKYSDLDINENGKLNLISVLSKSGKYKSNSEIRRLIQFGGVKLNGNTYQNFDCELEEEIIVQVGKGTMFKIIKE